MPDTPGLIPLLAQLDVAVAGAGAPFLEFARPGVSREHVEAVLTGAGIGPIPTELYEWWGWHNGTRATSLPEEFRAVIPGSWTILSVEEAVTDWQMWLKELPPVDTKFWHPSWLPIAWGPSISRLVVQLDASTPDEAVVGLWFAADAGGAATVAKSLADVATTWLRAIDVGYQQWIASGEYWDSEVSMIREFPTYS